jgi:hypothetical protein
MGLVEVGKTYVVSAVQKKALTAEESFKHSDGREVVVSKVYRNGELTITIHTEDEATRLSGQLTSAAKAGEEEFHTNDFSEWELIEAGDGQSIHFEYDGTEYGDAKDLDYYEFLEEKGFEPAGESWTCYGGLEVFEAEKTEGDIVSAGKQL